MLKAQFEDWTGKAKINGMGLIQNRHAVACSAPTRPEL